MDDESLPVLLPLGSLLVMAACWLLARLGRIRDARRYEASR